MAVLDMVKRAIVDIETDSWVTNKKIYAKLFFKNCIYTDWFLENPSFFNRILNLVFRNDPLTKFDGVDPVRGHFIYGHPHRSIEGNRFEAYTNELIRNLDSRIAGSSSNRQRIDVFHLAYYMSNALGHIQKFESVDGRTNLLPFNTGPVHSYFLNRKRSLGDAFSPKGYFVPIVSERIGANYDMLVKKAPRLASESNFYLKNSIKPDQLICDYAQRIRNSDLDQLRFAHVGSPTDEDVETMFINLFKVIEKKSMTRSDVELAYRIINLELLLKGF